MEVLERFTHELDVYSIDEAFLTVDRRAAQDAAAMTRLGRDIKDTLQRLIGVPVCVGIAPTTGAVAYSWMDYSCLPGKGVSCVCGIIRGRLAKAGGHPGPVRRILPLRRPISSPRCRRCPGANQTFAGKGSIRESVTSALLRR